MIPIDLNIPTPTLASAWTPEQLGVKGALMLAEAMCPVEHRVAKEFLKTLSIRRDDVFCNGLNFMGDAVDLFARVCELTRDEAIDKLSAAFAAEPGLIAETAPQIVYRPIELDADAPFPGDALPGAVRDLCTELARIHGVPAELPGLMALGAISAAAAKALTMPSYQGMFVAGNIYAAAGVPPGAGKSVLASHLFKPLHDYQWELLEAHRIENATIQTKLAKVNAKLAEAAGGNGTESFSDDQAAKLSKEKSELERAARSPRFLMEDATVEKTAVLLRDNDEFLANMSADAKSAITNLGGRYRNGSPEDDIYLKGFSGDPFYQDRISRDSVPLRNPRLVITWLTQQRYFNGVFASQALEDSGFACRFLAIRVESGLTDGVDESVPEEAIHAYKERIRSLLTAYVRHSGPPHTIAVNPDAKKVLQDFRKAVNEHRKTWDWPAFDVYPKRWAEIACKLTLLLHAAMHGGHCHLHPVCEDTAKNAVRLMTWFAGRQEQLLSDYAESRDKPKLGEALTIVENSAVPVTARDVARKKSNLFEDSTDAANILNQLVAEGRIRSFQGHKSKMYERLPRPGGKP